MKLNWWTSCLFLTFSCILSTSGNILNDVQLLAETQVASVLDSAVQTPPRTAGFEDLVPQQNIRLHCAKPFGPNFEQVALQDEGNIRENIDVLRPLTIVIHGWLENSNLTKYQQLSEKFRRYIPDANCCQLDWSPYAAFAYQIAARRSVPLVAHHLASFLVLLRKLNLDLENVSLVGFSMGGQISALAGKSVVGRIGAIFALDPAGPLFTHPFDVGPRRRLAATDARYVQMIATCRYALGMGPLGGTQNFLPNSGYHPQPPCVSLTVARGELLGIRCSHEYAVELFTVTLDPASVILGQKCTEFLGDLLCLQFGNSWRDRIGFYARRIPGNFYL